MFEYKEKEKESLKRRLEIKPNRLVNLLHCFWLRAKVNHQERYFSTTFLPLPAKSGREVGETVKRPVRRTIDNIPVIFLSTFPNHQWREVTRGRNYLNYPKHRIKLTIMMRMSIHPMNMLSYSKERREFEMLNNVKATETL